MKRTVISAAVLALAVAGVQSATAQPALYKVTGGGQTAVPADGPGDTVAFSAQSLGAETADGSNAKGQFQFQDRGTPATGNTAATPTLHGEVTCVFVTTQPGGESGGTAIIGGKLRDERPFRIDVTDAGNGAQGMDVINVRFGGAARDSDMDASDDMTDDALCDPEDAASGMALTRGNVTVHKAKENAPASSGGQQGGKGPKA